MPIKSQFNTHVDFVSALRDYFAGQWIAAGHHQHLSDDEAAEQAYRFADAMIAARGAAK